MNMKPIDGLRIFVGGAASVGLFWLWLNGYTEMIFSGASEPVPVSARLSNELADGAVGSGFGSAIAFMIGTFFWVVGTVLIFLFTACYHWTLDILHVLKSVMLSGKGWVESWTERRQPDVETDSVAVVEPDAGKLASGAERDTSGQGTDGVASSQVEDRLRKLEVIVRSHRKYIRHTHGRMELLQSSNRFADFKRDVKELDEKKESGNGE